MNLNLEESNSQRHSLDKETRLALNRKAREELKLKLLIDISIDLQVCELEGWTIKGYLLELQELINSFLNKKV
jgi:hypothetical protein